MNYITDDELEAVFKTGLNKSHVEGLRAVWNLGYDRAVNPYVPPVVPTVYAKTPTLEEYNAITAKPTLVTP
jgi:hypothetical protein